MGLGRGRVGLVACGQHGLERLERPLPLRGLRVRVRGEQAVVRLGVRRDAAGDEHLAQHVLRLRGLAGTRARADGRVAADEVRREVKGGHGLEQLQSGLGLGLGLGLG